MTNLALRASLMTCLGLATTAARAQDAFKATLPEQTLLYVSAPDIDSWQRGFQASPLYKIWAEEEVQEFLADLLAMGKQQFDEYLGMAKQMHANGMLPFDPSKLLDVRVKSASMAVTEIVPPGGQEAPTVSVVGCIDFGDTAKMVEHALGAIVQMGLAEVGTGPNAPMLETKDVGGTQLNMLVMRNPGSLEVGHGLVWAFVGGKLVIGTNVARTSRIVAALGGGAAPERSLVNDTTYRRVAQRVDAGRAAIEFFVRPTALLQTAVAAASAVLAGDSGPQGVDWKGVGRALDTLGFNGVPALGITSGYRDGMGFFNSFVLCPEEGRKGFMALSGASEINRDHLAWIPRDVGSFSIANLGSLEGIYTTVMDAVEAYDPEFLDMVSSQVTEVEDQVGFNIKKDIFGAFGPEYLSYSMPIGGLMATPELVLMAQCKDSQRTLEVLKKLCGLSDGLVSISESKTEAGTYYTIDLVLDEMGGIDPTGMLDPTFAFRNGFLVFGLSRVDVKGAIKRLAGEGGEDVRTNPAFKPLAASVPMNVDALGFSDMASTVDGIYGTLSGVLGMVPIPADVPVDLGLLPGVDTITKHLMGSVHWNAQHKDGFSMNMVGPIGPEIFVLGVVAIVGGAAVVGYATHPSEAPPVRRVGKEAPAGSRPVPLPPQRRKEASPLAPVHK